MSSRSVLFALSLAVPACTSTLDSAATRQEASRDATVPPVVDWVPGQSDPRALFPDRIAHLQTTLVEENATAFFAFGTSGAEVLWIYRVSLRDGGSFFGSLAQTWMDHEAPGSEHSHGIGGSVGGPGPRQPGPPGDPPFSDEYIGTLVAGAAAQEDAIKSALGELGKQK